MQRYLSGLWPVRLRRKSAIRKPLLADFALANQPNMAVSAPLSAALALAAAVVPPRIAPAAGASSTATQAGALIKLLLKTSGDGDDAAGEQQAQGGLGEQQGGLPAGAWDFGPHASVRVSSSGQVIVIAVVALLLCCWMCWCCKGCAAIENRLNMPKVKKFEVKPKKVDYTRVT